MTTFGKNQDDIMQIFEKAAKLKDEDEKNAEKIPTIEEPAIEEDVLIEQEVIPYIGLNGIMMTEDGEMSKHRYFEMLDVDQEKYSEIGFTPEEAKKISLSIRHMSTGINASIPMTCTGDQCPFKTSCPYVAANRIPIARPCLVEAQLIRLWTEQFINEFEVDMDNYTELHLVSELTEFNVYEMRITKYLADHHPSLMQDVVVSIDATGEEIVNQEISRAFDLKERIKKNRMKVLESLMATRKERVKLKIDSAGNNSAADKMSDLKDKLDLLQKDMKGLSAKE